MKHLLILLVLVFSIFTNAQNTGTIYRIRTASQTDGDKYVTVLGTGLSSPVELADLDESNPNQLWALVAPQGLENGCAFYSLGTKMSIDMAPTETKNRFKLLQWKSKFDQNQMFQIHSPGGPAPSEVRRSV